MFTSYLKNGLPLNEKNDIVYLSGASTIIKIKDILESVIEGASIWIFFGVYLKCQVLFIQYLLIPVLGYYGKPIILNINIHLINLRGPWTFKYWHRIPNIITSTNSGYRHWKLEVQHNFLNIISYRDGCSYGSGVI